MAKPTSVDCGQTRFEYYVYNEYNFVADAFYEGFDDTKMMEHMNALDKMEIRDDDVLLLAYPKSGTHLVREIVHMIQVGRIEYITDDLDFPIEYRDTTQMDCIKSPRTLHTHIWHEMLPKKIRKGDRGKVIAIFRNPKDVVVSFWHFLNSRFKTELPLNVFVSLMISGQCGCNSWYEWRSSLVDAKRKYQELPILVLKYEDLVQDLKTGIQTIASYLGKVVSQNFIKEIAEACQISTMRDQKLKNLPKDVLRLFKDGYLPLYRKAKPFSVNCGQTRFDCYEYNKYNFVAAAFYEGFDETKMVEHMNALEKMEIQDDDVLLLAYPKSGTHLVRELVHMIQVGRIEYIPDDLDFSIEYRDSMEMDRIKSPRTLYAHIWYEMLPKDIREGSRGKVIAIFRNPKDVVVSFWHFFNSRFQTELPLNVFVSLMISGQCGCNSWYEWRSSLVDAKRKYGELPILVLKYEDLVQNLQKGIRTIANYLGKEVSQNFTKEIAEACEISTMRDQKVKNSPKDVQRLFKDGYAPFYRKGKVGEWKTTLPSDLNAALDEWIASQKEDECDELPNYRNYYKKAD